MTSRLLCAKIIILASALAIAASSLWAQDGLKGALRRANFASPGNLAAPFTQTVAVADFDGDDKPDGAVLVDSGWLLGQRNFQIELHFSQRNNGVIIFSSPEKALKVAAWDINHDGYTDVIVEQAFTHKRIGVWLNDGHGDFHKGRTEDFSSTTVETHERLESPSQRADCSALCLRGTKIGLLTTRPQLGHTGSTGDVEALLIGSAPVSRAFSFNSPRAPPLSHSR